jgi:hypothetical protein
MVLQTKVFLVVLLQNYSPFVSRRKIFIRRVQCAINKPIRHMRTPSADASMLASCTIPHNRSAGSLKELELGTTLAAASSPGKNASDIPPPPVSKSTRDAHDKNEMLLFTRVPFPEPRRAVHMRPRGDKDFFGSPRKQ